MRVLGVLVAWGVLAVLATMCFAVGGSLGYRRGVRDTLIQIRDRKTGKTGCRPLPANHLRRRTSAHARPGARARRARWHVGPAAAKRRRAWQDPARVGRVPTFAAASLAAVLLIGIPGTAIGATTAQPGESLWKVKLGLERVRLALATTPERDVDVHVDLASARLAELTGLVGGDPAPGVVGDVSEDMGAHAQAAHERLKSVETPARTQLRRRIADLTEQQVDVIDSLQTDCSQDLGRDCAALAKTRGDVVALQEDSDAIVMDEAVAADDATPAPSPPRAVVQADVAPPPTDGGDIQTTPSAQDADRPAGDTPVQVDAQADAAAADAASVPTTQASSPATATATPKPTPSPSPSSTLSPAPAAAGSPATEATVDPSADEKPPTGGGGGSPTSDASGAAAGVTAE